MYYGEKKLFRKIAFSVVSALQLRITDTCFIMGQTKMTREIYSPMSLCGTKSYKNFNK